MLGESAQVAVEHEPPRLAFGLTANRAAGVNRSSCTSGLIQFRRLAVNAEPVHLGVGDAGALQNVLEGRFVPQWQNPGLFRPEEAQITVQCYGHAAVCEIPGKRRQLKN